MKIYLYLFQCKDSNKNPFKVGITKDIKQRLKQLQTGSPYPITCIDRIILKGKAYAENIEKACHTILKKRDQHLIREWFLHVEDLRLLYEDSLNIVCPDRDSQSNPLVEDIKINNELDKVHIEHLKYHGFY